MATKWKNSIVIATLAFLLAFSSSSIVTLLATDQGFLYKNYFETNRFRAEVNYYTEQLYQFVLNHITEEKVISQISVTDNEVFNLQERFKEDYYNLLYREEEVKLQIAAQAISAIDQERYEAELEQARTIVNDKQAAEELIKQEKIMEIRDFFKYQYNGERRSFLQSELELNYYFTDTQTNTVYTNMDLEGHSMSEVQAYFQSSDRTYVEEYILPQQLRITYPYGNISSGSVSDIIQEMVEQTDQTSFKGWLAVPNKEFSGNSFIQQYNNHQLKQFLLLAHIGLSLLAVITLIIIYRRQAETLQASWISAAVWQRIPLDLRIVLVIVSIMIASILMFVNVDWFEQYHMSNNILVYIRNIVWTDIWIAICMVLTYVLGYSVIMTFRARNSLTAQWHHSICYRVANWFIHQLQSVRRTLKDAFYNRSVAIQLTIVIVTFFCFGLLFIVIVAGYDGDSASIYLVVYMILTLFVGIPVALAMYKQLAYLSQIVQVTRAWAEGEWTAELPVTGRSILMKLATSINTLKSGVRSLQSEQIKSERLKTELITNVSHDLRTPLTSIITYTELLKREELTKQEQTEYLAIIDRKSQRLKVLIDDLFEVSKMASGNVELHLETIDVVQLLQQALAEHSDIIDDAGLQMRVTVSEQPLYAAVDGKRMWRVFDNLIENMVKYSLEQTRAYISIASRERHIWIVFKNISKYELNDRSEELFERFKRGDDSRQTDGSGLGLAISQSIIDLHDGKLELMVDGDLFKVTIVLRLQS